MQLPDDLMTVEDLAVRLGLNRKTVYELIRAGELPGVTRFGRVIRIHRQTIEEWIKRDLARKSA